MTLNEIREQMLAQIEEETESLGELIYSHKGESVTIDVTDMKDAYRSFMTLCEQDEDLHRWASIREPFDDIELVIP